MKRCLKSWPGIHQTSCDFSCGKGAFVTYPISNMAQPSRNFFVLCFHACLYGYKCRAFESSVINDFRKENDVLIQMKKLKIIKTSN
jgi:hypothetical protein